MRLDKGVKGAVVKKLSESLMSKLTSEEFNEIFLFLDSSHVLAKTIPYGVFEDTTLIEDSNKDNTSKVFKKWLDKTTGKIEKNFNKSRKLVRVIKEFTTKHYDVLAFNLASSNIFLVSMMSFFVDYDKNLYKFKVSDEVGFKKRLNYLREYLTAIFLIDLLTTSEDINNFLSVCILSSTDDIIDKVVSMGVERLV